jgi:23S rRNA pseudouridine955/2504/2580 synthase
MAHIGHALIGDGKYGINRQEKKDGYKYQALYSYKLIFLASPEENILSYLTDKEFSINTDGIWFIKDTEAR